MLKKVNLVSTTKLKSNVRIIALMRYAPNRYVLIRYASIRYDHYITCMYM